MRGAIDARVTWLLPIKNGMPYLPEALASIAGQTCRDWEILAWDNGSTDGTPEELQRWIPGRLPGRIVRDRPMRLGASLAAMVTEAKTELCARIDADDVNLPDRLARQKEFMRAHPEVAVVGGQADQIDQTGQLVGPMFRMPCAHDDIISFLFHGWGFWHPCVLFRRSAVLQAGSYRDVGEVNVEDCDLWFRMAAAVRLANLEETVLQYRVHPRSVTVRDAADDRLRHAGNARFCEHAPRLFGITPMQAQSLRTGRCACALPAILQVARHLSRTQGGTAWKWLGNPWFLNAARQQLASRDILTRLTLAMFDPEKQAFRNEARSIGGTLYRKTNLQARGTR